MAYMSKDQLMAQATIYPVRHADGKPDKRYSLRFEYDGSSDGPRRVLRFCGQYIGSFNSIPQATLRAIGHKNAMLNGVITEVPAS